MSGIVCLQGGHEFTPGCEAMDAEVVRRSGPGDVAVLAGAARVGADYAGASQRAQRHYEALGAQVVVVPDPRSDADAALATLRSDVSLVVLPGGSPSSLRSVLSGPIEEQLLAMLGAGVAVSGASAGAMVLCRRMVSPGASPEIGDGLGVVDGLALPHWTPGSGPRWTVPDHLELWGLPECGGVIVDGDSMSAVGEGEPARRTAGVWQPLPRSAS